MGIQGLLGRKGDHILGAVPASRLPCKLLRHRSNEQRKEAASMPISFSRTVIEKETLSRMKIWKPVHGQMVPGKAWALVVCSGEPEGSGSPGGGGLGVHPSMLWLQSNVTFSIILTHHIHRLHLLCFLICT